MGNAMFSWFQNFWPFSLLRIDDLKLSNQLVRRLPVPEQTKQFVFAIHEPVSQTVVYILCVQNLSEQSSLDAEYLIKAVKPDAVLAQAAPSEFPEICAENKLSSHQAGPVPTSSFGVLKKCFLEKINKEQYENIAGNLVLRDIFGVGFYGHFLAAKRAAEEVNSHFLVLESPYEKTSMLDREGDAVTENQNLLLQTNSLPPRQDDGAISNLKRLCPLDSAQSQMVKSLSQILSLKMSEANFCEPICHLNPEDDQQRCNYQAPWFARTIYSLLADLHSIFIDLPAIGKSLVYAQKMLAKVNEGEAVDTQIVSEVHNFRIAVEALRIALNNVARYPNNRRQNINSAGVGFHELPLHEKCHVLMSQGLKNQVNNFGSVVAIVDAASLTGIRKHWNTILPSEIAELAIQAITRNYNGEHGKEIAEGVEKKWLLMDMPVVAVGAGATACLGASSLSKALHASTFVKLVAYKFPLSLKFSLAHLQRVATSGLGKILGPLKLLTPGVASTGTKISSLKVTTAADKIHAVTHSVVVSAERTSLLAMRTAFYEIMRKRKVRPVKLSPWTSFGCSMATCAGLLAYGEGIECAAESVPSVPMIASLGRGLQSLHQASQQVNQYNTRKIQEEIQSLMCNINKLKVQ